VNIAAPIGVVDPRKRIQKVRAQMTRKREERAIEVVGVVAPLLNLVPDPLLESMAGSVVNSDVQASNVPGPPVDTYIAGAKVVRHYGIGPLPGVAMMAVLISRSGWVTITTRYDRSSINDPELWARCLLDGFNEVLALGGDGRAIPASFALSDEQAEPAVNGGGAQ
jgi:diacylglycerol O-acyltransferase